MIRLIVSVWVIAASATWGGASGADLSKYRGFKLGTNLPTVAEAAGLTPAQAKIIHRRPALIQELEWRPQPLGPSSRTETAKEVIFSFYNGQLFRIMVSYDRYATEGLTTADYIEAISTSYGIASQPASDKATILTPYGDQEKIVAEWQDSQYRFELIRYQYGPEFKLVGVLKSMEQSFGAALKEAARLDEKEAPQREAEQKIKDDDTERARLEKARVANKPAFRP